MTRLSEALKMRGQDLPVMPMRKRAKELVAKLSTESRDVGQGWYGKSNYNGLEPQATSHASASDT